MNKEYIDFTVVPYALADVLLALNNCGIKDFAVTKEDNDLHIRIDKEKVEKAVYPCLKGIDFLKNATMVKRGKADD